MTTVKYEPKAGDYLECEHGGGCCWQQWNGHDSLDEGDGRHALTVLSMPPQNVVERLTLPSAAALAAAIFKTDPEVVLFVREVSDWIGPRVPKHLREHQWPEEWKRDTDMARLEAAFMRAWDRDERGWATRATRRAKAILALPLLATPSESVEGESK